MGRLITSSETHSCEQKSVPSEKLHYSVLLYIELADYAEYKLGLLGIGCFSMRHVSSWISQVVQEFVHI